MTRKRDDTPEQPNSQSGRDRQTDRQMKGGGDEEGRDLGTETHLESIDKALLEAEDTGRKGLLAAFAQWVRRKAQSRHIMEPFPSAQDAARLPEFSREQESGSHAEDGNLSGRREGRVLSNADLFWEGTPSRTWKWFDVDIFVTWKKELLCVRQSGNSCLCSCLQISCLPLSRST